MEWMKHAGENITALTQNIFFKRRGVPICKRWIHTLFWAQHNLQSGWSSRNVLQFVQRKICKAARLGPQKHAGTQHCCFYLSGSQLSRVKTNNWTDGVHINRFSKFDVLPCGSGSVDMFTLFYYSIKYSVLNPLTDPRSIIALSWRVITMFLGVTSSKCSPSPLHIQICHLDLSKTWMISTNHIIRAKKINKRHPFQAIVEQLFALWVNITQLSELNTPWPSNCQDEALELSIFTYSRRAGAFGKSDSLLKQKRTSLRLSSHYKLH